MEPLKIKGLYEKLGIDQEDVDQLRRLRMIRLTRLLMLRATGQPVSHGVNAKATAARRARNKVARKSRRANR